MHWSLEVAFAAFDLKCGKKPMQNLDHETKNLSERFNDAHTYSKTACHIVWIPLSF